jgi:hypothetical protein
MRTPPAITLLTYLFVWGFRLHLRYKGVRVQARYLPERLEVAAAIKWDGRDPRDISLVM